MAISSLTSTLPIAATRPTSLRPRSTSMICSARSLGSASKIRLKLAFFFRRGAAPARAGDRAKLDGIAGEPHHGFRR